MFRNSTITTDLFLFVFTQLILHYRTFDTETAKQFTYVIGNKDS